VSNMYKEYPHVPKPNPASIDREEAVRQKGRFYGIASTFFGSKIKKFRMTGKFHGSGTICTELI
jgi:hypothetical protein